MPTPVEKLFTITCPKCGSAELRRRAFHVGCFDCGAWLWCLVRGTWVPLWP